MVIKAIRWGKFRAELETVSPAAHISIRAIFKEDLPTEWYQVFRKKSRTFMLDCGSYTAITWDEWRYKASTPKDTFQSLKEWYIHDGFFSNAPLKCCAFFFFFFKSKCRWYRATPTCGTQMGSPTDAVTWCLSLLEMKAVAELPIMNLIHCYKGTKHIVGWCRMRWKRRWKAGAERRQKIYLYCKQSGEVSESLPLLYFAYTDTYKYWIWIGR